MIKLISTVTLNASLILYFCFYIPQIIHNRALDHIKNFSIIMHLFMYVAYLSDLVYGFSLHLPWQYRAVSIVGLTLIILQHLQLIRYFCLVRHWIRVYAFLLGLFTTLVFLLYFLQSYQELLSTKTSLFFGALSQLCFLLYNLPQLLKNYALKSTVAMSTTFIYLNLLLSLFDTISAWCLNWGWPNQLGSPFISVLMCIALIQMKKYSCCTVSDTK